VILLITLGAVGLGVLAMSTAGEDLVKLQRKIAATPAPARHHQSALQRVLALLVPDARALDGTLRKLNQFGYDLDRLKFVARDEAELLGRVRRNTSSSSRS